MNCAPGDFAVIAGAHRAADRRYVGLVLRVVRVVQWDRGRAYWEFEGCSTLRRAGVASVCDVFLRPLRDREGVDETLVAHPVPADRRLAADLHAVIESMSAVERLLARHVRRTRGRAV